MFLRRVASASDAQVSIERVPLIEHDSASHIWMSVPRLLYFHEIPRWQQDNEYLLSGYR
jgi:adiponectin receptor